MSIEIQTTLGLAARYETKESLIEAAKKAKQQGYEKLETYTPFPVEELNEVLDYKENVLPWIIFGAGIFGGLGGFLMQYVANIWPIPLDIGGRPYNSWPAFIPITFELTILCAAIAGFIGLMIKCGFPEVYHPVFNIPSFERASLDSFFLCVMACDQKFEDQKVRKFLESTGCKEIHGIEA